MVNFTIDHKQISVPEGTTIMEAAAQNGIPIPKLCYLKDVNEIAACRVCVVELEGNDRLLTSCNNVAPGRHGNLYKQPKSTGRQKKDGAAHPLTA